MGTHFPPCGSPERLLSPRAGVSRFLPCQPRVRVPGGSSPLGPMVSLWCQGSHHHLGWGFRTYPHSGLKIPGFPLPARVGAHHHPRSRSEGAYPSPKLGFQGAHLHPGLGSHLPKARTTGITPLGGHSSGLLSSRVKAQGPYHLSQCSFGLLNYPGLGLQGTHPQWV